MATPLLGSVATPEMIAAFRAGLDDSWNQPRAEPVKSRRGKPRRNDKCECGSGRKWKSCCGAKTKGGDA